MCQPVMTSSDLSRCPLAMMQGLSTAIIQGLEDQGGLECEHGEPERQPAMGFSELSRFPLAVMQGLSTAIIQDLEDQGGLECEHGEQERQPGVTSSDLSRFPLAMIEGLGTAIIQDLQLDSESLPLQVGARSPQPRGVVTPNDVPPSGRPRRPSVWA